MYKRVKTIKTEKMFKWGDLIILAIILICLVFSIWFYFMPKGEFVEIYVDGKLEYELPLNKNTKIEIDKIGHNTVVIENGEVFIIDADCPDKRCEEKHISKVNEQIVCLPNKLVVIIKGDKNGGDYDVITE